MSRLDYLDAAGRLAGAVELDHPTELCGTNTCDVTEALREGRPYVAAHMLLGATECPNVEATVEHLRAELGEDQLRLDWHSAYPEIQRDWELWEEHFYAEGWSCPSCGAVAFGEDGAAPERCGNCHSDRLHTTGGRA